MKCDHATNGTSIEHAIEFALTAGDHAHELDVNSTLLGILIALAKFYSA